ncbi:MAG: R.Pab1 family restriction endonuclease [Verrucomicrobia bacterium]|nr:R.Pab1 family restriction endonuclease [Verrucomicrobiota bacterium]
MLLSRSSFLRTAALIALALGSCFAALGADTEYKQVRIEVAGESVRVRLPLTDVTGKVRPKEQTTDGEGEPIAPTKTPLGAKHYLEWQIGYDTRDANAPNVAKGVRFERKGEAKFGAELTKILVEALRIGIISTNDLLHERDRLAKLADTTLEEHEGITVEKTSAPPDGRPLPDGFARWTQKVPRFVRETESGSIQIQLKPRQRGVGNQAMIYVCLPMTTMRAMDGSPRPSGPARTKETVLYIFDRKNAGFLLDVVRAFGMASRQHNEDMNQILSKILENAAATAKGN